MDINIIRQDLRDRGKDHAIDLLDILLAQANEELIKITEVAPYVKGDDRLQNALIMNHIVNFLSGMETMSRVPDGVKQEAISHFHDLASCFNLELRRVS